MLVYITTHSTHQTTKMANLANGQAALRSFLSALAEPDLGELADYAAAESDHNEWFDLLSIPKSWFADPPDIVTENDVTIVTYTKTNTDAAFVISDGNEWQSTNTLFWCQPKGRQARIGIHGHGNFDSNWSSPSNNTNNDLTDHLRIQIVVGNNALILNKFDHYQNWATGVTWKSAHAYAHQCEMEWAAYTTPPEPEPEVTAVPFVTPMFD